MGRPRKDGSFEKIREETKYWAQLLTTMNPDWTDSEIEMLTGIGSEVSNGNYLSRYRKGIRSMASLDALSDWLGRARAADGRAHLRGGKPFHFPRKRFGKSPIGMDGSGPRVDELVQKQNKALAAHLKARQELVAALENFRGSFEALNTAGVTLLLDVGPPGYPEWVEQESTPQDVKLVGVPIAISDTPYLELLIGLPPLKPGIRATLDHHLHPDFA